MSENINTLYNSTIIILSVLCTGFVFYKMFSTRIKDRYAPVKTVKAQVADKFIEDNFSKIYGTLAKKPQYVVVFLIGNKKQSFKVSEFSYNGYRIHQRGTLHYKGTRLIDFH